jgi:transposase
LLLTYDYDSVSYKQRNIIERMSCRLKVWRRIATSIATSEIFRAAIALAATVIGRQ